jgi:hypothetical protein
MAEGLVRIKEIERVSKRKRDAILLKIKIREIEIQKEEGNTNTHAFSIQTFFSSSFSLSVRNKIFFFLLFNLILRRFYFL